MKLKPKARTDRPNPTAYLLTIGSAEARKAGLIGEHGELYEIEKTAKGSADVWPGMLIIKRKDTRSRKLQETDKEGTP